MIQLKDNVYVSTGGNSLWTKQTARAQAVRLIKIDMPYISADETWSEMRVYFDTSSWDVYSVGLIYTDDAWLVGFKQLLIELGFNQAQADSVEYSEQGMQGDDFVSLDAETPMIAAWLAMMDE